MSSAADVTGTLQVKASCTSMEVMDFFLTTYRQILTYFRLNRLSQSPISILATSMPGYVIKIFPEKNRKTICKQWRPWSDATLCRVWPGSALLLITHLGVSRLKMG